jgi:hypothetical protein
MQVVPGVTHCVPQATNPEAHSGWVNQAISSKDNTHHSHNRRIDWVRRWLDIDKM